MPRAIFSACFDEATRRPPDFAISKVSRFCRTLRESQVCECMCVSGLAFENTTALSPRQDLPCSIVPLSSLRSVATVDPLLLSAAPVKGGTARATTRSTPRGLLTPMYCSSVRVTQAPLPSGNPTARAPSALQARKRSATRLCVHPTIKLCPLHHTNHTHTQQTSLCWHPVRN